MNTLTAFNDFRSRYWIVNKVKDLFKISNFTFIRVYFKHSRRLLTEVPSSNDCLYIQPLLLGNYELTLDNQGNILPVTEQI